VAHGMAEPREQGNVNRQTEAATSTGTSLEKLIGTQLLQPEMCEVTDCLLRSEV
jgi:hypothetical protein